MLHNDSHDGTPVNTGTGHNSYNVRGRPGLQNAIKFSPQPKSIISEMLCRMRSKKTHTKPIIVTEDVIVISNSPPPGGCHRSDLSNHMEDANHLDGKLFSCDYEDCAYTCKLSSNLIKHKRVHTNDKPYLCDQCTFRSNFVNSLKVHKRTHTAERPYPCKQCNYRCNSSSNLKKHCLHRHPEIIKGN